MTAIAFRLERRGLDAVLVIEHASLGPARESILFAASVGLWRMGNAITTGASRGRRGLAFPESPFYARLGAS
jgi:hypothetical protein